MKDIIKVIQYVFVLLCIFFLTKYIHNSKDALIDIISNAKIVYLFISFTLWTALVFFVPWFSHTIIYNYNKNIGFSDLLSTYVNRLPAKYLPGGIWHTVARFHDLSRKGLRKKELSILVFYENFWPVLTTSIIGGLGVYFYHKEGYWSVTSLTIFIIGISFIPILLTLRKNNYIFPLYTYIKITLITISFWLLASLSFLYYLNAFNIVEFQISHIFNYMLSWLIGFLSIFTPQGIGVFELTMFQLTPFSVSLDESMVVIAGFRLVIFISDLINWLIYLLYKNVVCRSPI